MVRESLFVEALYEQLFQEGIRYFMPQCKVETTGHIDERKRNFECRVLDASRVEVRWLGGRHRVDNDGVPFTTDQWRMINSIGAVLSGRLQLLLAEGLTAGNFDLFRGLNEDRYVSAFLDPVTYSSAGALAENPDRVGDAIEVLRASSLTKYEGSHLGTGALLLGRGSNGYDRSHKPPNAIPYSDALTAVRSFYRMCDGVQTLAIVDAEGHLVELADIREWAEPFADVELPVPGPTRYERHAQATVSNGHVCLVLTTNHEIKVFANGRQVMQLLNGRWRLMDVHEKYRQWQTALGGDHVASCLFRAALNVAEDRCGGLFVILDDPHEAEQLVAAGGLVGNQPDVPFEAVPSKEHLHYLVRGKRATELAPAVLESIACIDGAILLARDSTILAFGAILHNPSFPFQEFPIEGGRTTAALGVSRFGKVLKISEDGPISFYENQSLVWDL